jgi:predicted permease
MIRTLRALFLRVLGLFRSTRAEGDFAEELDSHLRLHIEENVRAGMTTEEARRDALVKLGGIAQTQEAYRDRRGLPSIDAAWQDLRRAVRLLLKRPTLLAATTLSIGIGAGVNVSVYAVLHRVLFESLVTAAAPDRLVRISPGISYLNYLDLRSADLPIDLATMTMTSLTWRGPAASETISAHVVSDNFFDVVGVRPLIGQPFHTGDSASADGIERVVITFGFWQQRLSGDPSILGKAIRLNDDPYVVAAVLPNGFRSMALVSPNVYLPTSARVAGALNDRKAAYFDVIGRLRDNATRDQATAALRAAAASLEARFPEENKGLARSFHAVPATGYNILNEVFPAPVVPLLAGVVYGLVGVVLLIACANVAGLLVARAEERRHETAVRIALGATRRRLAQQFLAESFVIAIVGCACGAALWQWSAALIRTNPAVVNVGVSAVPSSLPLVYCVALALVVALLCGLAPAWTAGHVILTGSLQERRGRHGRRRFSLQRLLVSGQVAICFILLSAAAVLVLTFLHVRVVDPGFDVTHTISIQVRLPRPDANDFLALRDAVSTVSGVQAVSSDQGFGPPVTFFEHIRRADAPNEAELLADVTRVGPRYFETMGIPIERGRDLADGDFASGRDGTAVVVNQMFVRRYFAGSDPIDKRLVLPGNSETGRSARTVQIVGVARDNKATTPNGDSIPVLYSPQLSTFLLVRVAGPAVGTLRALEEAIHRRKPEAIVTASTMTERLANALSPIRIGALLISALGGAAVVLAMTGLYGVVSFVAKRRSFEIGVRMALGATRSAVIRLLLRESLLMVGLGCVAGGIAAFAIARAIRTILAIQQSAMDAVAFASVFVVLLATGVVASLSPARRAATTDPIVTLRHE